jgi:uncharacterized protein (TIGR03437 family)
LWGENLSDRAVSATSLPLSSGLNDVCVYSNSVPVPLQFVSPNQINAQLPYGAPGTADLTVVNSRGQSVPLRVTVQESAPAVFRLADGAPLVVRADNGRVISESNPILLDGRIIVYLTGLGAVSPFTEAGAAPPPGTLVTTSVVPKVYIGPVQLFTLWSGLAPGFAGVNQINAQVPFKSVSTGSKVQFTILQGNVQTVMYLPVR